MTKQEFLDRLREALAALPEEEISERLSFYEEMIDDLVEEGRTEAEACTEIGSVEELAAQILAETPIERFVRKKVRGGQLRPWEILLLVLGFPLWLPLLIAAFAVALSLYLVLWSLVFSLWVVGVSVQAGAIGCLGGGLYLLFRGEPDQGLLLLSGALVLAGLGIFLFFGCRAAGRGAWKLTKGTVRGISSLFTGKERKA